MAADLVFDCNDCTQDRETACADCLVSFIVGPAVGKVSFTKEEGRVLTLLQGVGLVPEVRYEQKAV
ncbi:MAG: hypothetical protein M1374_05605 [Firmicutes bacterium]|jgi:hypothetical protein|nr:hypothetical protein [Bacillota bacterium]